MAYLVNQSIGSLCLIASLSTVQGAGAQEMTPEIMQILSENPDPFSEAEVKATMKAYGPDGSGVALLLGGVPLALVGQGLVSNVENIGGATGITADPSGFGFTIGLSGDYLFEFDKFDLTDPAIEALAKVLLLYDQFEGTGIVVEGHTDAKGSEEYNQGLSERRAQAVVNWFVENGIRGEVVASEAFGETVPVAPNTVDGQDNPEGRALNRRVEIRVTTNKRVNALPTVSNPTEN